MLQINIAVISDLHLGENGRIIDTGAAPGHSSGKSLLSDFLEWCTRHTPTVDFLIIPGDLTTLARPREFDQACRVVEAIAAALRLSEEKVIFVPGNHDVDWAVINADPGDPTGFRRKQRYEPLSNPEWLFGRRLLADHKGLLDSPFTYCYQTRQLLVVGYNSSWHDDPSMSMHHGLIDSMHLNKMQDDLSRIPYDPKQLRVFVVHHHLMQYSDPIPGEPDFSAMTNAGNLLSLLRSNRFDLVINGHKHSPHFETFVIDSSWPITILTAGSFAAKLDTRWSGIVNNMFHLLEIQTRDPVNHSIAGRLRTWAYLAGKGWIPSGEHNGIRHDLAFGANLTRHALKETLTPIIEHGFESRDYLTWEYLCNKFPSLEHVAPPTASLALGDLEAELSFYIHGDPPSLVLLRQLEDSDD
jgi:3',5'-cyclic AMP phosphodiesterase CpdA